MADDSGRRTFPRLPAKNWWTLREKFKQSVPSTVDADYLQSVLGLTSPRAAANLLGPLRSLGLIDEGGQPTRRAYAWRLDDSYAEVCDEMLVEVYPDSLRSAFPDPSDDREGVNSWFSRNTDSGQNAASAMAALFALVSSGDLEAPKSSEPSMARARTKAASKPTIPEGAANRARVEAPQQTRDRPRRIEPAVNVNVQIHISSEASAVQIDQIFKSMAEHLYGPEQQPSE